MSNTACSADQRGSKTINPLLLLGIIFALPVLTAVGVFNFSEDIGLQTKNQGSMLAPTVAMDSLQLLDRFGRQFSLQLVQTEWLLIYVVGASCAQDCADNVLALEQIRRSLGKDYPRTGMLLILTNTTPADVLIAPELSKAKIPLAYIDVDHLTTSAEALLSNTMPVLFLADLHQQIIMQYKGVIEQQAIYDDLRWLLKVSPTRLNETMITKPKNSGDQ